MMSLSTKILIYLGIILTIGVSGFIVYKQIEISNRQVAIETQMVAQKQLIDGIVRSQSQWTTRDDMNKFITANNINLKAIQDDLDKLNGQITAVNVAVATSQPQKVVSVPSTSKGPGNPNPVPVDPANPDPNGYMKNQQNLSLNEDFGTLKIPIGDIGFSAWQSAPWSLNIKQREYDAATIIGTDENQRMYVYNKFTVKVDDKSYEVPIKTSNTQQVYPEPKFSWWNPRLYIGVDGAVGVTPVKGEFTPNLNVQIMSYGQYKTQPDLSILQIGAGYGTVSQRPQLVVTPILYNVGKHIPLMNNAYIGPSISVGTDGNVFMGGGLRVGL
jgi:hypothetical protein